MSINTVEERRRVSRTGVQTRVQVDLLHPKARLEASSVNLSEQGLCFRLQESLEIRSAIKLRLFTKRSIRPLECSGRVAWVVQRLDLRPTPPFVYDIGIEFVDPSPRLRLFASSKTGRILRKPIAAPAGHALQPAVVHGREYVPRLEREPASTWHLVIRLDGLPCFSRRFPSLRAAL
jgi:hypothetical protein